MSDLPAVLTRVGVAGDGSTHRVPADQVMTICGRWPREGLREAAGPPCVVCFPGGILSHPDLTAMPRSQFDQMVERSTAWHTALMQIEQDASPDRRPMTVEGALDLIQHLYEVAATARRDA